MRFRWLRRPTVAPRVPLPHPFGWASATVVSLASAGAALDLPGMVAYLPGQPSGGLVAGVLGLVALSVADEAAAGEALLVAPLHRRSADKLDADADRLFDEAAGLTDLIGARWLRDARDSDEQVEDAGYIEHFGEDGFRYLRAAGISRRGH